MLAVTLPFTIDLNSSYLLLTSGHSQGQRRVPRTPCLGTRRSSSTREQCHGLKQNGSQSYSRLISKSVMRGITISCWNR